MIYTIIHNNKNKSHLTVLTILINLIQSISSLEETKFHDQNNDSDDDHNTNFSKKYILFALLIVLLIFCCYRVIISLLNPDTYIAICRNIIVLLITMYFWVHINQILPNPDWDSIKSHSEQTIKFANNLISYNITLK